MKQIKELSSKISNQINIKNDRIRSFSKPQKQHFDYSIQHLITNLWKVYNQHSELECSINKRSGSYSELKRYRDPNLTYKMTMKAFDGLEDLRLIYITKKGYYDRNIMKGSLTKFRSTIGAGEVYI